MIRTLHEGLLADGRAVPLTKLCAWFGVPRRTVYYKPAKAAPKVDPRFAEPIKAMIEKEPSFGYRTVAWLLGFNKNTVQRIFQIKGWQVRKRPIGMRPRIEAVRPEPVSGHLSSPARHAWAVSNPFGSAFCAGADGAPRSRRNPDAGRPMRVDDDARHHRHARADADGRRAGRDVHAGWAAHPWRAKAARRQSSPMPPEWRG